MRETRTLAAILVADVVGYNWLAGADEDRILARLRGPRGDLANPAIAADHGRIDDGSLIKFRSVADAVRGAIEVPNGVAARNAGPPRDRRTEFRVGVHGEAVEGENGNPIGAARVPKQ
jgi:class 3 adenylate cyclase